MGFAIVATHFVLVFVVSVTGPVIELVSVVVVEHFAAMWLVAASWNGTILLARLRRFGEHELHKRYQAFVRNRLVWDLRFSVGYLFLMIAIFVACSSLVA